MTVKPLTKEQKLDIVSKAIDAGANISVHFHTPKAGGVTTSEQAKELVEPFLQSERDDDFSANYKADDYKFEVVVYYPQKETAPEWQDTGYMEEANA